MTGCSILEGKFERNKWLVNIYGDKIGLQLLIAAGTIASRKNSYTKPCEKYLNTRAFRASKIYQIKMTNGIITLNLPWICSN